ncbi:glycerol-3-phosphate phosphatase [Bactrocera dorsalis]|uniref:Glycerol-3-phosphate phosphatase n=1 Tax=Bactrocera dorsalis TaxID=27457 RepID=A0A6I9VBL4_BACDO|nr:glycerol-3-phosphate phosphatase [Bactrocera dorsalis]
MNKKPTDLVKLTKAEMAKWLNGFDTVLTDCRGVLWLDKVINGAPDAIALLKTLGKEVYFVTNNSKNTRREIWQKATASGFEIDESHIIAPINSIVEYLQLRNFRKKVYIIGAEAVSKSLTEAGIESFGPGAEPTPDKLDDLIAQQVAKQQTDNVGAVIVGFDKHFSFVKLFKACNYISSIADCLFMTTNADKMLRFPAYRIPDTFALTAAVEACVERKALQFGKPNPEICQELIRSGKIVPKRTLMIGDVCEIDMLFGHKCGFQTLLVGSGPSSVYEFNVVLRSPKVNPELIPDFVVPSLGHITKLI